MNIGIDVSRANHAQRTGVEEYAFQIIQNLKKMTPDNVRVVLYTNEKLTGELSVLPKNWSEKILNWPPKRFWTQVRLSWEMLVNTPDVLFVPAHVPPIIHPKKTVTMIHDIAALKFPQSYNWFERWYSIWSAKYSVKKLWKVISPSEFTKNELLSVCGIKELEKIKVIHHGFDQGYKVQDILKHDEILEKYHVSKPFIMTIGRLEEKKNTVNIIKAFEKIKFDNLKLLLVGKPGFGYEKVKMAIANSQSRNGIINPGWVDEKDLPILLSESEVFVFPSLYEGFGLPVLQAFASGVPVVAGSGSSLEEVGGDACLYVKPQGLDEISNSISKILNDPGLKQGMIERGKERIEKFSWEKSAKQTWELLLGS